MEACLCHLRFLSSFGKGRQDLITGLRSFLATLEQLVGITGGESSVTRVQSIANGSFS